MIEVLKPGLETSVQELPGRIGFWEQGFPPSGPVDDRSFRLANLLVGNDRDAAALECQFMGPTLRFGQDGYVAVTGADMTPRLDGASLAPWRTHPVRAGQELGQVRPNETLRFSRVSLAQDFRRALDRRCTAATLVAA